MRFIVFKEDKGLSYAFPRYSLVLRRIKIISEFLARHWRGEKVFSDFCSFNCVIHACKSDFPGVKSGLQIAFIGSRTHTANLPGAVPGQR